MESEVEYIRWFEDLRNDDVPLVGGKNASLGEMIKTLKEKGVRVPDGFATTCLLYTSPSPRDRTRSRMPSSA